MMNVMKNVFTVIFSVVLLIAVLAVRIVPLALFIFLIIQSYLHNIEYHKAILIAISVSSIFLLFGSIITSNELLKLNYKEKYSNKMIVGGSIMVQLFITNFQCRALESLWKKYAILKRLYLKIIILILGLIFIKHAEIILIVYYIVYYIIFLKKFYLKR